MRPNPSIERACLKPLCAFSPAADVERQAERQLSGVRTSRLKLRFGSKADVAATIRRDLAALNFDYVNRIGRLISGGRLLEPSRASRRRVESAQELSAVAPDHSGAVEAVPLRLPAVRLAS